MDVLSVTDFTKKIKNLLEKNYTSLWIQGEVSNLRKQTSGHFYFTLKDAEAQIPCVLFRGSALGLKSTPKEGDQVLALGSISVYEPRGAYQLVVKTMQAQGIGNLQLQFEKLKKQLQEEGLFDIDRKQVLPKLPKKIALVTSPTGAALRDFVSILKRRGFNGTLLVFPSLVQGIQAPISLKKALHQAINHEDKPDLVILMRGGGSLEDLFCFNDESLTRAIANCKIPTISAVGHEIDYSLADFAADLRAETPSAAAEIVSSEAIKLVESLQYKADRLKEAVVGPLREFKYRIENLASSLNAQSPKHKLQFYHQKLDELSLRVSTPAANRLREYQSTLKSLTTRLESTSLHNTLQRGFVVVQNLHGNLIKSAKTFKEHPPIEPVMLTFHDGQVEVFPIKPL